MRKEFLPFARVVTGDEAVFEKASLLKFHGMDREAWKRFSKSGSPRYDVAVPGFKYNMMDIQAALRLHQLRRLEGFLVERALFPGLTDSDQDDAIEAVRTVLARFAR